MTEIGPEQVESLLSRHGDTSLLYARQAKQ